MSNVWQSVSWEAEAQGCCNRGQTVFFVRKKKVQDKIMERGEKKEGKRGEGLKPMALGLSREAGWRPRMWQLTGLVPAHISTLWCSFASASRPPVNSQFFTNHQVLKKPRKKFKMSESIEKEDTEIVETQQRQLVMGDVYDLCVYISESRTKKWWCTSRTYGGGRGNSHSSHAPNQ